MSGERPLAAAAVRLRRAPGRPRIHPRPEGLAVPEAGHSVGTPAPTKRGKRGRKRGALDSPTTAPRLLGLKSTAAYLGVSAWTVRDLETAGLLVRVRIPLPGGGDLRKLLFDVEDLNRLITAWKETV